MLNQCHILLAFVILSGTVATDDSKLKSDLEAEVQWYMVIDCFMHEEIQARRERLLAHGEALYPIIRRKLKTTTESFGISRLLSLVIAAPGDHSKMLPAIRELVESQAARDDPWVLFHVANTLGKIGGVEDVPVLLELFRFDSGEPEVGAQLRSHRVRVLAARALADLAGPEAIEPMEQSLQQRAADLSREQIRRDPSFLEGYLAIARIRHRSLIEAAPQGKQSDD